MQVIGKTNSGFILSATADEVANLCGYYYSGEYVPPQVGAEVAVSSMYHRLYNHARMKGEIESAQKVLRRAADDLDIVKPIVDAAQSGGNQKEGGTT